MIKITYFKVDGLKRIKKSCWTKIKWVKDLKIYKKFYSKSY